MIVDLRSDVLSKPSPEMIEAMTSATFGDDVFDEDLTTHELQERVAELTGMEAALFVVSGTMANQLAIASLTQPHNEVILDVRSHIFQYEQGAPAIISGVQTRSLNYEDGIPDTDEFKSSLRTFYDIHQPLNQLLCLEVTHNYNGGQIPDFDRLKEASQFAKENGLKVHIDGARIWNAVVKTGIDIKKYAALADTLMFCFSKGLGTPIGSVLVGTKETIHKARYFRKGLGGGWRQPGMLAAAAIYALENNIDRLKDDHSRAQKIAEAVKSNPNLELTRTTDTNMIFFSPKSADLATYSKKLTKAGILHDWEHFGTIRLVTNLNITDEMIDYTIEQLNNIN